MSLNRNEFWLAMFLLVYLFLAGIGAAVGVVIIFPAGAQEGAGAASQVLGMSKQQQLILLAALAGVAGSFLHAAQSLSSYIGNGSFKASWTVWYFLRPWIGGILGFAIYFALRAGLVGGTDAVNPYGVVALGVLGGWFSKTTTDKLKEVFETLFLTDEDQRRKDKLHPTERPAIDSVIPSPIPATQNEVRLLGQYFLEGAMVLVGAQELEAEFVSDEELKISLDQLDQRPSGGTQVAVRVRNPEEHKALSEASTVVFE